jgi:hypothetical protein
MKIGTRNPVVMNVGPGLYLHEFTEKSQQAVSFLNILTGGGVWQTLPALEIRIHYPHVVSKSPAGWQCTEVFRS